MNVACRQVYPIVLGQDLCFLVQISGSLPVITIFLLGVHCSPGVVLTGTVNRLAPDKLSGIFPVLSKQLKWSRYLVERVKRNLDFSCCG